MVSLTLWGIMVGPGVMSNLSFLICHYLLIKIFIKIEKPVLVSQGREYLHVVPPYFALHYQDAGLI